MKKREKIELFASILMIVFAGVFFILAGSTTVMSEVAIYLSIGSILPIIIIFTYQVISMIVEDK